MNRWWMVASIGLIFLMSTGGGAVNQAGAALSLQTAFNVTQTYTDNLFFVDDQEEDDFGTYLGPDITLLYENPDIVIGVTYFGRLQLFVNNFNESRYTQNANILLELPFLTKQYRGLSVTVDEYMNFTPQLDAFTLSEAQNASSIRGGNPNFGRGGSTGGPIGGGTGDPGGTGSGGATGASGFGGTGGTQGVVTSRANAFYNRAGLTLAYAWSPRLDPQLQYTNQYRHFFDKGFQDSLAHGLIFTLPYKLTQFTTVFPSYSYRQTDFLGKSTQTTSADRTLFHDIQLGVTHAFSSTLNGTISGGLSFVKQVGATEQVPGPGGTTQEQKIGNKFVGTIIGAANLTKAFERGTMSLSGSQTTGSGGGLAAQATRTLTVTGRGTYALTRLLNVFASVGWGRNDSVDGDAFDTNTYRFQTGLNYLFTRWLSGNLSYSRIDQRSKGTVATDVVVNQVFLGLTAIADPWFLIR